MVKVCFRKGNALEQQATVVILSALPQPQVERRAVVLKETARDQRLKEKKARVEKKFEEKKQQLQREFEEQLRRIASLERKAREDAERVERGKQIKLRGEDKPVNFSTISTADVNAGNVGFRGGKLVRIKEFEARVLEVRSEMTGPVDEARLEKVVARFGELGVGEVLKNYAMHKEKWVGRLG